MMNTRKTKILKRAEELDNDNERHLVRGLPGQPDTVYIPPRKRLEDSMNTEEDKENKRPRTPEFRPEIFRRGDEDKAPSSTVPELMDESCFIPRTPEGKPPPTLPVLQHSPAWCDPVRPLDILGGQYPDPISMDFAITRTKRVNRGVDVYFVGIRHGFQSRPWNYTIQSPPCSIQFVYTKFQTMDQSRILLSPCVLDGSFTSYPAEFMAFVDHVENLSERLKSEMNGIKADTSNWKHPFKYSDGICLGIYAKVKNHNLKEQIKTSNNRVKCTLKLSCVYISSESAGMTFELTSAYV